MMDEVVTYQDDQTVAALVVKAADSRMEFQRWRLRERVKQQNGQYSGEASWLHMYAWPDLAVCVSGSLTLGDVKMDIERGNPLPFEVYLAMPEALVVELEDALYRLNPQWVVKAEDNTAASEKKEVTNSTGA